MSTKVTTRSCLRYLVFLCFVPAILLSVYYMPTKFQQAPYTSMNDTFQFLVDLLKVQKGILLQTCKMKNDTYDIYRFIEIFRKVQKEVLMQSLQLKNITDDTNKSLVGLQKAQTPTLMQISKVKNETNNTNQFLLNLQRTLKDMLIVTFRMKNITDNELQAWKKINKWHAVSLVNKTLSVNMQATQTDLKKESIMETTTVNGRPLSCHGCFSVSFKFHINNNDICKSGNKSIEIIILISSSSQNGDRRTAIRETWLRDTKQNKGQVRYVFLLGESEDNITLKTESLQNRDIIQGNFKDSYYNLTYKTLMGMQWAETFCSDARFVMKTDDDMYINIPGLIKTVHRHKTKLQTAVGGYCLIGAPPIRHKSKWYASFQSYPQDVYPGFCSGTGYITSMNVVSKINRVSKNVPFFHLEDIYIALCINHIGYNVLGLPGFYKNTKDPCLYKDDQFVTAHQVSIKQMKFIWNTPCKPPRITNNVTDIGHSKLTV